MAVRRLIAERGFEGLRMRDIAERVGINIATLHYHIPSKEALITLVAQSLRDDFIAQHRARPRGGLTPLECMRLEFADFRDTFLNTPDRYLVMGEMQERSRRDPAVAAAMAPMRGYWHQQWRAILEAGRTDGTFRADLDPSAAASIIIGGMIATTKQPNPSAEALDRVFSELERCFRSPSSEL
ncbi:TetR/AcrR family transcriptional regulator [Mesorhizobium sp. J428]|uniref:TetR/AcrR family transcriptional regulator n=1 Tax=Mesorhizobium sp. J428 TaxID=2898440 RepID=UPI002151F5EC|nr:TetR/AcrR family transcriptional regulator [Mesorhizobium sp. J428]MCR5858873.1 TetR/AcrR family transcriptional regulator; helix-turn-helix transcriptional regulator [Mesorhizobium sp. J428]